MKELRPWLRRADWRAGVVRSDPGSLASVILSVVFGFLGVAVFIKLGGKEAEQSLFMWGCATAIAGTVVFHNTQKYLRGRRYGIATFEFDKVPFIVGTKITGTIKATLPRVPAKPVRAQLISFVSGDNESDRVEAVNEWQPDQLKWVGNEVHQPIEMQISTWGDPTLEWMRDNWRWRIDFTAEYPNLDYYAAFEIPVCKPDAAPLVQDTGVTRGRKRQIRRAMSVFDDEPR